MLWKALLDQAIWSNNTYLNRADLNHYLANGYCAADPGAPASHYSASCTLAYAFDDWALAELSALLGKPAALVAEFTQRSLSYRKIWEPEVRHFCPRYRCVRI